ncbi:hypothetical protein, partial [Escherichia coli]|uniref:hypothetical protein n=1 Tax=Escherichia coli TaxID=562 RepID=UPI0019D641CA
QGQCHRSGGRGADDHADLTAAGTTMRRPVESGRRIVLVDSMPAPRRQRSIPSSCAIISARIADHIP